MGPLGYPTVPSPQGAIFQSPNSIPTLSEALFARSQLTITRSELHQLHVDIAFLLTKRAHLLKRIRNCDAILAPHKRLPAELISRIFCFVIPPRSAVLPLKLGRRDLRLQLTQVCSTWRKIAFDIPSLWNLRFVISHGNYGDIELGKSWWSQCSGSLLKLTTTGQLETSPNTDLDFPLVDKIVLPFSNRLRRINLNLSAQDLKNIMSASPGSFDNLQAVVLSVHGEKCEPWAESDSAFLSSPTLHSVSLSIPGKLLVKPNLPWRTLTQLTFIMILPSDICLLILSECTALLSCSLGGIDDKDLKSVAKNNILPALPLCLPLLDAFSVRFQSGGFSPWLSHLTLPNLLEFTITIDISHQDSPWTEGCEIFFKSMETSLHSVEIKSSPHWVVSLDDTIFSDFPHIRSFLGSLNHRFKPSTMEKIARGEILRNVESLQFHAENAVDVANMLKARRSQALSSDGAISLIKKIKFTCRESEPGVRESLDVLRSQGMAIENDYAYWSSESDNEY